MILVSPVKEDQLLLPQDDEDGVAQLRQLGQDEQRGPESIDRINVNNPITAQGVAEAVVGHHMQELGGCAISTAHAE